MNRTYQGILEEAETLTKRVRFWKTLSDTNCVISEEEARTVEDIVNVVKELIEERDAAVSKLHGICSACSSYSWYHRQGKCEHCKWDTANHGDVGAEKDNWEWSYIPHTQPGKE